MPFVRFSRDKRGYEHVYLVHTSANRGHASPARVLYWYRTPPGVKVGREPFDEGVRRALEAEYPNLVFDWKRIVNTPMPPPEAENWRERRRSERAMRQARAAEDPESEAPGDEPDEAAVPVSAAPAAAEPGPAAEAPGQQLTDPVGAGDLARRRRRRGGRRRRKPGAAPSDPSLASTPGDVPVPGDSLTEDSAGGDTLDPHEEE